MTENIFIGIFRLRGHQGMGKTCACFKFKEKVWLWDTLLYRCNSECWKYEQIKLQKEKAGPLTKQQLETLIANNGSAVHNFFYECQLKNVFVKSQCTGTIYVKWNFNKKFNKPGTAKF